MKGDKQWTCKWGVGDRGEEEEEEEKEEEKEEEEEVTEEKRRRKEGEEKEKRRKKRGRGEGQRIDKWIQIEEYKMEDERKRKNVEE